MCIVTFGTPETETASKLQCLPGLSTRPTVSAVVVHHPSTFTVLLFDEEHFASAWGLRCSVGTYSESETKERYTAFGQGAQ